MIALTLAQAARIQEIARRAREDASNDAANINELLELLEILGAVDPDGNPIEKAMTPGTPSVPRGGPRRLFLQTLIDDGYLQEANRRFFHPLGLALTVERISGTSGPDELYVQDHREDLEGIIFDPGGADLSPKAARVARLEVERRTHRMAALGFWIQPASRAVGYTDCYCGHSVEDHYHDAPAASAGSTACTYRGCICTAYERDESGDEA